MRSYLLVLALALAACPKPTPGGEARLEPADGGIVVSHAGRSAPVPTSDLGHAGPRVPVSVDESGKVLAYRLPGGGSRIVFAVGDALFLGPTTPAVRGGGSSDFSVAPKLDDALGAIFENAEGRRELAVAAVKKEKGDSGVALMLGAAAHVDDPAWEEAFAKLPEREASQVKTTLARRLEPGQPSKGLARAVRVAPLGDPARAPTLAARVRELVRSDEEPRAAAVMLRAVARSDAPRAGAVGCEVLHAKPKDEVLLEAAALAVAHGGGDCEAIDVALGEDYCAPWFRCKDGKPLDGGETTLQDEPLCTKAELGPILARDLERAPDHVMNANSGARPGLFAYAALVAKDRVPPAFASAHARRRYALTQPKAPECDTGMTPGTPCHCEEAVLRDWACRHRESSIESVGVCRYEIDDQQKKLLNVVATPPP